MAETTKSTTKTTDTKSSTESKTTDAAAKEKASTATQPDLAAVQDDVAAAATKTDEKKSDEEQTPKSLPIEGSEDLAQTELTDAEKELQAQLSAVAANPDALYAQVAQVDTSGTSGRTDRENLVYAHGAFHHPVTKAMEEVSREKAIEKSPSEKLADALREVLGN